METRGGDDETRLLRRRVQELDQANLQLKSELADVERRRRRLAGMVFRLQRRNAILSAAAEQRSGAVSFLKKGSGLWSRQVHILSTMLARWHVENKDGLAAMIAPADALSARAADSLLDPQYAERRWRRATRAETPIFLRTLNVTKESNMRPSYQKKDGS